MSEQQPAGAVPAPLSLLAVLTGAGISTDSGIPDYRGPNGVWRRDPEAEKLVTYSYYLDDPQIRRRSWQMRRESRLLSAVPGPGHRALVALARAGLPLRVITQNVDGLHQAAGLTDDDVLELHGTARKVQCIRCKARSEMSEALRPGRRRRGRSGLPDLRRHPEVGHRDVRRDPRPGGAQQRPQHGARQ